MDTPIGIKVNRLLCPGHGGSNIFIVYMYFLEIPRFKPVEVKESVGQGRTQYRFGDQSNL